jgi:hypothetical protein
MLNIELDERGPGSQVRDIFAFCHTRRRNRVQSLTAGSVNSLRYDTRLGTVLSTDLPTVEETLSKTEEGNGTPVPSLRSPSLTPSVLQRNNTIHGDQIEGKEKAAVSMV